MARPGRQDGADASRAQRCRQRRVWLRGACEPLLAAGALMPLVDLLEQLPRSLAQAVRSGRATPEVLAGMLALLRDRARARRARDRRCAVGRRRDARPGALHRPAHRCDACAARARLARHRARSRSPAASAARRAAAAAHAALRARAALAARGRRSRPARRPQRQGPARGHARQPVFRHGMAGRRRRCILPAAVRDAVLGRAAPLSAAARDMLELVSAAPAGLELDVIDCVIEDAERGARRVRRRRAAAARQARCCAFATSWRARACIGLRRRARAAALHGAVFDALSLRGAPTARLVHHALHGGPVGRGGSAWRRWPRAKRRGLARTGRPRRTWRSRSSTRRARRAAAPSCTWRIPRMPVDPPPRGRDGVAPRRARDPRPLGDAARRGHRPARDRARRVVPGRPRAGQAHARAGDRAARAARRAARTGDRARDAWPSCIFSRPTLPAVLGAGPARARSWLEAQGDAAGLSYALSIVATAELCARTTPTPGSGSSAASRSPIALGLDQIVTGRAYLFASLALVHRRFAGL